MYIDYLERIHNISLSRSFDHLLQYYYGDNIESIKVKNNILNNLNNMVNYIDIISFNDDMLDDYYRDKTKKRLFKLIARNSDFIKIISNISSGINIEKHFMFKSKNNNPLTDDDFNRVVRTINGIVKRYFEDTYNKHLKTNMFYEDIPYVFLYNYIDDYNNLKNNCYKDNIDLCSSPFYIINIIVNLTDEDDRNDTYITIPILVFPFLNKLVTIFFSFCNKTIYDKKDYLDIKFITKEYKSNNVDEILFDIVQESIDNFLKSNPYYMTNLIRDIYLDDKNLYFGNIIYDKVCGFLRNNGASRHFIITKDDDMLWLDKFFIIYEDIYKDTDLYKKIIEYEKKNIKDYNDNCYSWIDNFYNEDGMANINLLFNDLNQIIDGDKKVEPLLSYTKEKVITEYEEDETF